MKSLNELEENKEKDLIINGIMKSKGLYCLIALPKVGKSLLALQISDCISNNKQFLGFDVNPSPVLYISTENYGNQLYERTNLMKFKCKIKFQLNICNCNLVIQYFFSQGRTFVSLSKTLD